MGTKQLLYLNIGSHIGSSPPRHLDRSVARRVIQAVMKVNPVYEETITDPTTPELTYFFVVPMPEHSKCLSQLCLMLPQECIAVYSPQYRVGNLFGPQGLRSWQGRKFDINLFKFSKANSMYGHPLNPTGRAEPIPQAKAEVLEVASTKYVQRIVAEAVNPMREVINQQSDIIEKMQATIRRLQAAAEPIPVKPANPAPVKGPETVTLELTKHEAKVLHSISHYHLAGGLCLQAKIRKARNRAGDYSAIGPRLVERTPGSLVLMLPDN